MARLAAVLAFVPLLASRVPAASFLVDTTADEPDVASDGICATASATCSLRAAVTEVNRLDGRHRIRLPAGRYRLAIPGQDNLNLVGDLDIRGDVDIRGDGAATTIIDGNQLDRPLSVEEDKSFTRPRHRVTIRGVTLTGGRSLTNVGGGIQNDGRLKLIDVVVEGNTAALGGGIDSFLNAELTLVRSVVRDNVGTQCCGGIRMLAAAVKLSGSIVAGNSTPGAGGGLVTFGRTDRVTLVRSTVSDNVAGTRGGGLLLSSGSRGRIVASTITGNRADGVGGGIFHGDIEYPDRAIMQLDLVDTTISANVADPNGANSNTGSGGGIFSIGGAGTVRVVGGTIAGNADGRGLKPDCAADLVVAGTTIGEPFGCFGEP